MVKKPTLSPQQKSVLRAIVEFYDEFGAPPNGPQVAERAFGDSTKRSLAWYHIRKLRKLGILRNEAEVSGFAVPISLEDIRRLVI